MEDKISALKTIALFLGVLFLVLLFFFVGTLYSEFDKKKRERAFCAVVYPEEQKLLENEPEVEAYLGSEYDVYKGEILFKTKCAACHKIPRDLIGPRMEGLMTRMPSQDNWLASFLTNEEQLIANKEEYTLKLNERYGDQMNHKFKELSEDDIKNLSGYILQFN